jgi:hypothetical protein
VRASMSTFLPIKRRVLPAMTGEEIPEHAGVGNPVMFASQAPAFAWPFRLVQIKRPDRRNV